MNLIQKVWNKVARELKPSAANAQNERWSFFRVMLFLTSKRGQRRIRILLKKSFHVLLRILSGKPIFNQDYQAWIKKFMPSEEDFARFAKEQESFDYRPLISIVVPVFDPPPAYFRQTLESVLGQVYPNWELCLADDCSPNPEIKAIIEEYRQRDARIKVVYRETNGHISAASNSALELATGEFISLLDHD
ncbi:MAG: glycosyltransferase, partial [Bacteroidota bacterium]